MVASVSPAVQLAVLSRQMRPYQRVGVAWLMTKLCQANTHAVGLCDEPGLGKTLQALAAALALGADRIIVAAPAGARRVWSQEIARWLPQWSSRVFIVEPGVTRQAALAVLDRLQLILLIAYDSLSERNAQQQLVWARTLAARRWDLLVLDEAHYLKNASNRTCAVYGSRGDDQGLHAACDRVVLLTGTLTPNHAGELWHHMRALWPASLVVPGRGLMRGTRAPTEIHAHQLTQAEFEERVTDFRDTRYGRQVIRSKNQTWLRERLGPFILRRTKAQVLPELPPLQTQDVPLAMPSRKHIDAALWRQGLTFWDRTRRLSDDQFLAELNRVRFAVEGGDHPLVTLRRELGLLKVQPALEWIVERLSCGIHKMLVFGWHIAVLTRLHELLAAFSPVLVTGRTSPGTGSSPSSASRPSHRCACSSARSWRRVPPSR